MFTALFLTGISLFALLILKQAGFASGFQVAIGLILLPIVPVVFFLMIVFYVIKFFCHLFFGEWA